MSLRITHLAFLSLATAALCLARLLRWHPCHRGLRRREWTGRLRRQDNRRQRR